MNSADPNWDISDPRVDDRGAVIIGIVVVILPITALVVALRLYTRRFLINFIGIDDWVVLLALVFAIAKGITLCLMANVGLGAHIWTLSRATVIEYNKRFYVAIILYYAALGSIKVALLLQYRRIFADRLKEVMKWILVVIGAWSLGLVLVSIFTCNPIQGYWDKSVAAVCVPNLQWYIHSAGNISSDIVIFALPIPVLWSLRLSAAHRLALIAVFCMGFFNCSISIIRIQYLPVVNRNPDVTYINLDASGWSIGEVCMGIVCACLPTLRPLVCKLGHNSQPRPRPCPRIWYRREPKRSYPTMPTNGWRTLEEAIQWSSTSVNGPARCGAEESCRTGDCICKRAMQTDFSNSMQRRNSAASTGLRSDRGIELIESPTSESSLVESSIQPLYQPQERRRPSVQSILDEIVITLPPNAMLHDGLDEYFLTRVRPSSQPSGFSTGPWKLYDEPATPAGLAPRKMKRLRPDGSTVAPKQANELPEYKFPPSASADKRNEIRFRVVNWAPRPRSDPDREQQPKTEGTSRPQSASKS